MHTWKTIAVVLLINYLTADVIAEEELSEKHECKGEMIRRAKIQPMYPDYEYGAEGSDRFYDPIEEKCLTKVDEPCPETNATCAPNSECELRKSAILLYRRCYCSEGMISNLEKTYCGTPADYGEDCSDVSPHVACDRDKRLSCHNQKCACQDPAHMEYDAAAKKCMTLAKGHCENDGECVEGAYCTSGSCQCVHGATFERHCYKGFLQACSADKPCNNHKFLRCTDGFCKCEELLSQFYETNKCEVLVGGHCKVNRFQNLPQCVSNAECADGVCRCAEGFSATREGICRVSLKGHGETCENEECDFNKGLACVDGSCKCLDDAVLAYDLETKSCVASLRMKCGLVDRVGDRRCDYRADNTQKCPHYYISCASGLQCNQIATTGESTCSEIR